MEEPFESYFDRETLSLVGRFEKMIQHDQHYFFDVDEYEEIIEYYFFKNEQRKAFITINQALDQHPGCTSIMVKLAQYLVNAKKDHEALRILKEIDHSEIADSDLYLAKGNLYSQLEKPEKAIALKTRIHPDFTSSSSSVRLTKRSLGVSRCYFGS